MISAKHVQPDLSILYVPINQIDVFVVLLVLANAEVGVA
jgi:hypothetical protein